MGSIGFTEYTLQARWASQKAAFKVIPSALNDYERILFLILDSLTASHMTGSTDDVPGSASEPALRPREHVTG